MAKTIVTQAYVYSKGMPELKFYSNKHVITIQEVEPKPTPKIIHFPKNVILNIDKQCKKIAKQNCVAELILLLLVGVMCSP